jgi:hypothetical protein
MRIIAGTAPKGAIVVSPALSEWLEMRTVAFVSAAFAAIFFCESR